MAWVPKEKEIDAMLSADVKHRYEYFIHRVCDTQEIWGLYNNGWACLGDGEKKFIPFFPHSAYAEHFRKNGWDTYQPKCIDIEEFIAHWIPKMKNDGIEPAIFPVGSGNSVVVNLADLEANLQHELSNY